MPDLNPALQSSEDPSKVANTIKGALVAFSSIIILVASNVFHITLTADNVITLGTELGALGGSIWFFYGLLLKGTIKMGSISKRTYDEPL